MSETENTTTTDDQTTQVKEGDQTSTDQGNDPNNGQEDHNDRYKRDMLRYKTDLKSQKESNDALLKEIEELKSQRLKEKEDYKSLYESANEKYEKEVEKNRHNQDAFFGTLKRNEIEKEAIKLGITKEGLEDLNFIDTSGVITETTSEGNVNILGAKEFIDDLKQRRPGWFNQTGAPKTNTANPGYQGEKTYNASELLKLQKDNPAEYQKQILKILGRKN